MPSDGLRVTDDAGVEFVLGERIAAGGQGAVYRVHGFPDHAIKLLKDPADLCRIAAVRRLPLDGLPVAAPITLIRTGGHGYLMRLASDMAPITRPYLPPQFGLSQTTADWYLRTGGLRRRLAIAANIAQAIAALHERGLAYVDLNPNNAMVSVDPARSETWLIDTDNLTSRAAPDWNILGFPGYAAPERKRRHAPPSTLADAYTLAVHVFRMLVLRHPLEGVAADELDGDEAREAMDRGDLPYVGDPADATNRLPAGKFPAGIVLHVMSGRMVELAAATFGAGRLEPAKRPGAARWRDVLFSALDNVVDCPEECGWTLFRLASQCPNCGARATASAVLTVYSSDGNRPLAARDSLVVSRLAPTSLLARHVWGHFDRSDPVGTLTPVKGGFEFSSQGTARLLDAHGKGVTTLPQPGGAQVLRVKLEASDRPTRFLAIREVPPHEAR